MAAIERLPGTRFTPTVALHRLLQRVDEIRALVVVEQDQDGRFFITRTAMSNAEVCAAAVTLMDHTQNLMMGRIPAEDVPPDPKEKA